MDDGSERPCYSMRLAAPFLRVLKRYPELAPALEPLEQSDPDDRIPIETLHQMLEAAIQVTGNPDLGLEAAAAAELGDSGAADYVVTTVDTVAEAIEVLAKYHRLINDALSLELGFEGDDAIVRLENGVALPRAAADFQLAGLFRVHFRSWMGEDTSTVRVMVKHPAPSVTSGYDSVFGEVPVVFGAAYSGFAFPKARLDAHLERADSRLHEVIRSHAEQILARLPEAESVTQRTRALLVDELATGNPNAENVASQLGMSVRTLGRKLGREGTTFTAVLDDLRKRLAAEYVGNRDLGFADVALLLGFSQAAAFHRAFRRWTGVTPLQYRRQRLR